MLFTSIFDINIFFLKFLTYTSAQMLFLLNNNGQQLVDKVYNCNDLNLFKDDSTYIYKLGKVDILIMMLNDNFYSCSESNIITFFGNTHKNVLQKLYEVIIEPKLKTRGESVEQLREMKTSFMSLVDSWKTC